MKKILFILFGVVIITSSCQTNTELTDADKEALVQSLRAASEEYWSLGSVEYTSETYAKMMKFVDNHSDQLWQTDPVTFINNIYIINTNADFNATYESVIGSRYSTPMNILKAHYSVISDKKVLEVLEGDFSIVMKDGTVQGPMQFVITSLWSNIDGDWKLQFTHNSFAQQSE